MSQSYDDKHLLFVLAGIINKRMGHVGDSPIIGAGVYAGSETCVCCIRSLGQYAITPGTG